MLIHKLLWKSWLEQQDKRQLIPSKRGGEEEECATKKIRLTFSDSETGERVYPEGGLEEIEIHPWINDPSGALEFEHTLLGELSSLDNAQRESLKIEVEFLD